MTVTSKNTNHRKQFYWITLIGLFVFSLTAGFLGFESYFIQRGEEHGWVRSFYRTLQLFTFEGGDLLKPIPWELQLTRFTAPLTTMLAFILALLEIFKEQWNRMKIARLKDHVVIIGLGTKGKNVMEEGLRNREKVLIIEIDPLNPHLASIRQPRCRLILGNANNLNILKKAKITKAKTVYLLMGEDSQQVEACLLIYQLIKESRRNKKNRLHCIMHLLKQDYLNILRNHKLVQNINDGLELSIFNVYENSARELFQENPPDRSGLSKQSNQFVQIIIFGFGHAGEALALQTGITGHYLNWETALPRVIIFDRQAEEKVRDFEKRYPSYHNYCDIKSHPIEANSPQLIPELVKYLENPDALNTIVLCFDNKTNNMLMGLQIDSIKLNDTPKTFQTFIRTGDNESFSSLSDSIKPYGLPSKVCSHQVITGGDMDNMAKAVHSFYYNIRRSKPNFGKKLADFPWEELSQEYKDSNRKAADHIGVKMRGIGLKIIPKDEPGEPVPLSDKHLELLEQLEHRRWCAERSLAGWTLGKEGNSKTRKTPHLVDWGSLSREMKDYDRSAVMSIPAVLNSVDLKIVK